MKKKIVIVECAIEYRGKYLMIKKVKDRGSKTLFFPGGKLEISDQKDNLDALKQCILREVEEEVGLKLSDTLKYITSKLIWDNDLDDYIIDILFYCKIDKTEVDIKIDKSEIMEYFWLEDNEITSKEGCPEWMKGFVQSLIRHRINI